MTEFCERRHKERLQFWRLLNGRYLVKDGETLYEYNATNFDKKFQPVEEPIDTETAVFPASVSQPIPAPDQGYDDAGFHKRMLEDYNRERTFAGRPRVPSLPAGVVDPSRE